MFMHFSDGSLWNAALLLSAVRNGDGSATLTFLSLPATITKTISAPGDIQQLRLAVGFARLPGDPPPPPPPGAFAFAPPPNDPTINQPGA